VTPPGGEFGPFDASELYSRNRRGTLVADAVEGLLGLWRQDREHRRIAEINLVEAELLAAAAAVLRSAAQGLTSTQLAACAMAYATLFKSGGDTAGVVPSTMQSIVQEAVRKLSNFAVADLRRLHEAASAVGTSDPYFERAQRRRFPRALRKELQQEACVPPVADLLPR